MGQRTTDYILMAIRITVWIQGLFSGFVTIRRFGKWLSMDINLLLILIRQTTALVGRALAEVCNVPVLLVSSVISSGVATKAHAVAVTSARSLSDEVERNVVDDDGRPAAEVYAHVDTVDVRQRPVRRTPVIDRQPIAVLLDALLGRSRRVVVSPSLTGQRVPPDVMRLGPRCAVVLWTVSAGAADEVVAVVVTAVTSIIRHTPTTRNITSERCRLIILSAYRLDRS